MGCLLSFIIFGREDGGDVVGFYRSRSELSRKIGESFRRIRRKEQCVRYLG